MRVFDSLATTAKLGLLAEALPDFRFHTLEIDAGRALVDPRSFPLGALFAEASLAGPDGKAKVAAPEHIIVSALYLQGGMRNHLRKGLDRLFEAERQPPRPADTPFTLAISLDFEKRAWVEQAEAVSLVLALLLAHHPRVELMSSGMTAAALEPERDRFADIAEREGRAIEAMLARLPAPVVVHRLHGQTIPQKARALARATYFLGPVGSASLLPLALGLPGVMFGGVDAVRGGELDDRTRRPAQGLPARACALCRGGAGRAQLRLGDGLGGQQLFHPAGDLPGPCGGGSRPARAASGRPLIRAAAPHR
jgi:hypothetical protein